MMMNSIFRKLVSVSATALAVASVSAPAQAQSADGSGCIGQITLIGGNYCPRGTAEAAGALLAISSHDALFSILGTQFGGDGRTTFGLPDLRGRMAAGRGNGPGIGSLGTEGTKGGTESFTLTTANLPSHKHNAFASGDAGSANNPNGSLPARAGIYHADDASGLATMAPTAIQNTGGGSAYPKVSPIQAIQICVITQGIYCSRS